MERVLRRKMKERKLIHFHYFYIFTQRENSNKMKETQIIQTALNNLEQTRNIKGRWKKANVKGNGDGEIDLYLEFNDQCKKHFYVEVKRELRAHHLKQLKEMAAIHQAFM